MEFIRMFTAKGSLVRTIVVRFIAIVLILFGLVMFPTPIPFGAIILFIGLAILISESKTTRNFFKHRRKVNPRIDNWIRESSARFLNSSARIPTFLRHILDYLRKILDRTDPNSPNSS